MKIAIYNVTTTVAHGGVETFAWEVSRELASRGHDVHVVGGKGGVIKEIPGVRVITFPFRSREQFPNLGSRFRKFAERRSFAGNAFSFLRGECYDLFVILKPYDLPLACRLKEASGCRVIMAGHGTDFFPGDRRYVRNIDGITTCSRFNGERIEERYRRPAEIIYNGVDTKQFHPMPVDDELRAAIGLKKGDKVIIYAGRLVRLKGVDYLLDAFARLPHTVETGLLLIGDGPEKETLRQRSQELGIAEKVVFAGYVPNHELPRYYSLAYAAVLPTVTEEAFGIAIAEAMACGIPVIATNVGGIPEVADPELLVKPADSGEIAARLLFLLDDEARRREIGERGRRKVAEMFTWSAVVDRLLNYCNGLMEPIVGAR